MQKGTTISNSIYSIEISKYSIKSTKMSAINQIRINNIRVEIQPDTRNTRSNAITDLDKAKVLCREGKITFKSFDSRSRSLNRLITMRLSAYDSVNEIYEYENTTQYSSRVSTNIRLLRIILRLVPVVINGVAVILMNVLVNARDCVNPEQGDNLYNFTFRTQLNDEEIAGTNLNHKYWCKIIANDYTRPITVNQQASIVEIFKGDYRNGIFKEISHSYDVVKFSKLFTRNSGLNCAEIYTSVHSTTLLFENQETDWSLTAPIRYEVRHNGTDRLYGYRQYTLMNRNAILIQTTNENDIFILQRPNVVIHPDLESDDDENVVDLEALSTEELQQRRREAENRIREIEERKEQQPVQQPQRPTTGTELRNLVNERLQNVVLDESNSVVIRFWTPEYFNQILRELSANARTENDIPAIVSQMRMYMAETIGRHTFGLNASIETEVNKLQTEFKNRNKKFKMIPRHLYDALYKEGAECSVCMDNMTREKFEMTHCGHQICRDCLYQLNNYQCPTCKCDIKGQ